MTIRRLDPDQIALSLAGPCFVKLFLSKAGARIMSVYEWARQELHRSQDAAQEIGFDPGLTLRAMLSAVVQQSKGVRSFEDLADELQYLAENLDDQQEYAFMRP
jgi:hypothetical protein